MQVIAIKQTITSFIAYALLLLLSYHQTQLLMFQYANKPHYHTPKSPTHNDRWLMTLIFACTPAAGKTFLCSFSFCLAKHWVEVNGTGSFQTNFTSFNVFSPRAPVVIYSYIRLIIEFHFSSVSTLKRGIEGKCVKTGKWGLFSRALLIYWAPL